METEKKARGKRGQGCVYQPKGSRNWWVKFSVNGRVIQKSAETESRREALDFLDSEKLKHKSGEAVTDDKITVDALYGLLTSDYRINGNCVWWSELNWNKHLKPFFGGMRAKNVGTDTLSRYIEARRAEKASNGSINRELSLLQRAFMLGYEAQPRKVARPLRFHRLAESKPRNGFIERKQYDALAAKCPDLFMRAMLALGFSFGFRKSELIGRKAKRDKDGNIIQKEIVPLKVGDVDLMHGILRLGDSKNGDARKVSLTQDAKTLLAAYIAGKSAEDAVFTRGKGLAGSSTICGALPSATWSALESPKWFA